MYPGIHTHTRVCTLVPPEYAVYPTKRTLEFEEPSPHLRGRTHVTGLQDHSKAAPDVHVLFSKQESDAAL